jgi:uncharacterized Zn finger protein
MEDYANQADYIKLTPAVLARAILRAKEVRPFVKRVAERVYAVTGSRGNTYRVELRQANGHRLGKCDCASTRACFHIAAACALNIAVQSARKGAQA